MKNQNRSTGLYLAVPFLICAVAFAVAMTGMAANAQTFSEFEDIRDTTRTKPAEVNSFGAESKVQGKEEKSGSPLANRSFLARVWLK